MIVYEGGGFTSWRRMLRSLSFVDEASGEVDQDDDLSRVVGWTW